MSGNDFLFGVSKGKDQARDELLAALREAQSRLACAEPARRLDACSCWQGFEAAIRVAQGVLL